MATPLCAPPLVAFDMRHGTYSPEPPAQTLVAAAQDLLRSSAGAVPVALPGGLGCSMRAELLGEGDARLRFYTPEGLLLVCMHIAFQPASASELWNGLIRNAPGDVRIDPRLKRAKPPLPPWVASCLYQKEDVLCQGVHLGEYICGLAPLFAAARAAAALVHAPAPAREPAPALQGLPWIGDVIEIPGEVPAPAVVIGRCLSAQGAPELILCRITDHKLDTGQQAVPLPLQSRYEERQQRNQRLFGGVALPGMKQPWVLIAWEALPCDPRNPPRRLGTLHPAVILQLKEAIAALRADRPLADLRARDRLAHSRMTLALGGVLAQLGTWSRRRGMLGSGTDEPTAGSVLDPNNSRGGPGRRA